ncbi:hypothetical protein Clacol_005070 [Clathrus columnatus]|uniref:Glucose-methanol-choline oxidoreductase N-terminal domain-containing protein n=1 Tax=Clathrus columnatus TaxID=1419009 RepID=A0AAV5AB87_9AGAM|nr:hypothetical protein Clacol_005070 [Clathrus columnatus]
MGATVCAAFIDSKGQRSSAATAYLTDDVLQRPNLSVAVGCRVERVLFDNDTNGTTPRAVGVELRIAKDAPLFRVSARKEVILSAGAYGTPHLLLVSGVGPRKELEDKIIHVVKDLPAVGKNLVDHPSTGGIVFRATANAPTNDYLTRPLQALLALAQWFTTGGGPMAVLGSPGAIFVRSDDTSLPFGEAPMLDSIVDVTSGPNSPDLEFVWIPLVIVDGGRGKAPPGVRGVTMSAICLRPQSSGEITLKTNDIWDKPIIDPKWFTNENDMRVLIRGMRLLFKIARTEPLVSHTDLQENYEYPFLWPGSANPDTITDEELKGYIRKNFSPAWHPACTARMGKSEDSSVVNSKLQVHGIKSLRIVDASIFPNQLSGHPCAPIIAISEKASDIIKVEYSATL